MTADHRSVYITSNKGEHTDPDENTDYIFEGLSPLFYKQSNDTLDILSSVAATVPKNAIFTIKQVELSNPEMMNLLDKDNYKTKGWNLIE